MESRTGIHAVLLRIAEASRLGDSDELNAALLELSLLAERRFRAKIERRLASYAEYSRGYSVSIDDASDALNELLWVVCQKAQAYRGATDAEADAWLNRIVERRLIDKGRVITRRAAKWREIFALAPKRLKAFLETSDTEH
ncbi:MAG: hypothetical protein PHO46_05600 [Thermoguttaceae bacterium]|jgi:DNA-directed RNA polymerase specialized sigma24 family protein|nr:hypothetical protein [Thermoguttaceae bacterium]